jgi:hypothetical protein
LLLLCVVFSPESLDPGDRRSGTNRKLGLDRFVDPGTMDMLRALAVQPAHEVNERASLCSAFRRVMSTQIRHVFAGLGPFDVASCCPLG